MNSEKESKMDLKQWIIDNYPAKPMEELSLDFNDKKEAYFTFDNGKTQHGPVLKKDLLKYYKENH